MSVLSYVKCKRILIRRVSSQIDRTGYGSEYGCSSARVSSSDFRPLIYDRNTSHFPPNTSVLDILNNLMIEDWNFTFPYDFYWQACAPIYCTYSDTIHTKSFIGIVIALVSMIGGLITGLQILASAVINLIYAVLRWKTREPERGIEKNERSLSRMSIARTFGAQFKLV